MTTTVAARRCEGGSCTARAMSVDESAMRAKRLRHAMIIVALLATVGGAARAGTLPEGFEESLVVDGLDTPTAMAFAPDDRIFVAQKGGRVRIVADGVLRPNPFLTVAVSTGFEHGLGGIVLDPAFADNRHLYVYYSPPTRTTNRLSRFTASATDPFVVEPGSERILIDDIPGSTGFHNGGALHFGPDGMLYVGTGDSGLTALPQNLGSLAGKILRIDPASHPDLIPLDNPFVGTAGARGEIWALGVRNPFTAAFDPATGLLYVNDVGSSSFEEINDVRRGRNYGWAAVEGPTTNPAYTNAIYSYPHAGSGAAVTGGVFYSGRQFPSAYHGKYLFADYVRRFIRVLDPADHSVVDFVTGAPPVLDLDVGPDGSLYALVKNDGTYAFSNSEIRRIAYVGNANRAPVAAASADPTNGAAPLAVTFSAAASHDPDGDPLTYTWSFGDDAPLAEGVEVVHTYMQPGTFVAVVTVRDPSGAEATSHPITITTDNQPPVAAIAAPADGARYRAGETIAFEGLGVDPEDGELPASAYAWEVLLHHNTHTHPVLGPLTGTTLGSFEIPLIGEIDPDQWYRIHLVVTDTGGLTASDAVDVVPHTAAVSLAANVPGLALTLDEQAVAPPITFVGVSGAPRVIGAPLEQQVGAVTYGFVSWSDGGPAVHTITTPEEDAAFTASYAPVVEAAVRVAGSGRLRVAWRNHAAGKARDRFGLTGISDPSTLPRLLGSREMRVALNGIEIARAALDAHGRSVRHTAGPHVRMRLSPRSGRYRVAVNGLDLRTLLGVADVTEARGLPVAVTITLTEATRPLLDGALAFAYRSRAGFAGFGAFPIPRSQAARFTLPTR